MSEVMIMDDKGMVMSAKYMIFGIFKSLQGNNQIKFTLFSTIAFCLMKNFSAQCIFRMCLGIHCFKTIRRSGKKLIIHGERAITLKSQVN